jgi:hypothetical protein
MTLTPDSRIRAFIELGKVLGRTAEWYTSHDSELTAEYPELIDSIHSAGLYNPWFTNANVVFALNAWREALKEDSVYSWFSKYQTEIESSKPKKVAVIMAGNIPLVGFHDFICTLLCGHLFIGKLSSDDNILLPAIADVLCYLEPGFKSMIQFTENTISEFDAIIATGSDNTARYFEYYFSKYPNIIRKNRNGIAILNGNESTEALVKLGFDICMYFGLGCRSVSKVFIPAGYDPAKLFVALDPFISVLSDHYKYMNNHNYVQSVYLLNNTLHLDNGTTILTESAQYSSPIPVVFYEYYENIDILKEKISNDDKLIQCIVSEDFISVKSVPYGKSQYPGLSDYADGIDTMEFLTGL